MASPSRPRRRRCSGSFMGWIDVPGVRPLGVPAGRVQRPVPRLRGMAGVGVSGPASGILRLGHGGPLTGEHVLVNMTWITGRLCCSGALGDVLRRGSDRRTHDRQRRVTSTGEEEDVVDLLEVPLRAAGGFFAMSADTLKAVFSPSVSDGGSSSTRHGSSPGCRWFRRVLVAIPFTVLVSFTLNILLREIGAADLSGAGAALGAVTQVGPIVTVLIVAGAGRDRDLRGPRCANHPRRDRRDARCSASIRSTGWWCRGCSPRPSSRSCSTAWCAPSASSAASSSRCTCRTSTPAPSSTASPCSPASAS